MPASRQTSPRPASRRPRGQRSSTSIGVAIASVLVVGAVFAVVFTLVWRFIVQPRSADYTPPPEQCVAETSTDAAVLTLEQSQNAAIIVAESLRRGLPARAATIAITTAYQESGLRNLDYGDRDSVGLFQQRPSQGWGTVDQIMNPWYSAGKFYEALVKLKGWQTGDITTYAQKVQRSAFPDAYRKHEANARIVASVLTGNSPAGMLCIQRNQTAQGTASITSLLGKALKGRATVKAEGNTVTITSANPTLVWAGVHLAMAMTRQASVVSATVGSQTWNVSGDGFATWEGVPDPLVTSGSVQVFSEATPSPSEPS